MELPLPDHHENEIHRLQNLVREMKCVQDIFNIAADLDIPLDAMLQQIAETIQKGFQNPENICCCLNIADISVKTPNCRNPSRIFETEFNLNEKGDGKLSVGCVDHLLSDASGLSEQEKNFLEILADRIGMVLQCKVMKDTLQESEKKYRLLAENSLVGIYQTNMKGDILYTNHACLKILGYKSYEEVDKKLSAEHYRYPDDRKTVLNILKEKGKLNNFELELVRKNEDPIFVLLSATLDSDVISGMMMDITQHKNSIKSLEEIRKQLSQAQRIAHLGSWDWEVSTGKLRCSDEAYRIFGREPQEFKVTYSSLLKMLHPDDRIMIDHIARTILIEKERKDPVELRILLPDNSERIVELRGKLFCNEDGKPVRMIGTILDITKSKEAENSLKNAFKEIKKLKDQLEAENIYLREEIETANGNGDIIGTSDPIKYIIHRIRQVAKTNTTVLLRGETGVGKNVFARFLHKESDRQNKPLIQVNCAGLPANLIESELFGREKGAFTGSTARQIGRFELAHNGTILLDEIGELPIELQAKLLRVIEEGTFERLGDPHTIKVDARIIACTNRNLEEEVKNGRFREDLYFRLNVFPITIPSLRQRKEDIPLFINHFVSKFNRQFRKKIEKIPRKIMNELENYPWPGNVRELINVIERSVIVSEGTELHPAHGIETANHCQVCENIPQEKPDPEPQCLADMERNHILQTLLKTSWRVEGPHGAAKILEINPNTLRSRMRKMGIKRPEKEEGEKVRR